MSLCLPLREKSTYSEFFWSVFFRTPFRKNTSGPLNLWSNMSVPNSFLRNFFLSISKQKHKEYFISSCFKEILFLQMSSFFQISFVNERREIFKETLQNNWYFSESSPKSLRKKCPLYGNVRFIESLSKNLFFNKIGKHD